MFVQRLYRCSVRTRIQYQTIRWFEAGPRKAPKSNISELQPKLHGVPRSKTNGSNRLGNNDNNSTLPKSFWYTVVSVPAFFTGCIIWQHERIKANLRTKKTVQVSQPKTGVKEYGFRDRMDSLWNAIFTGRQTAMTIIAANIGIYLLWRVKPLYSIMTRYFLCMPTKAHSVTSMTLSGFSHQSGLHIFVNMYVLLTFTAVLDRSLGSEQLLAMYLSGATISSFTSSTFKVATGSLRVSLGASGALLSLLAFVCCKYPDSRLSIAFLSSIFPHSFSASTGLLGIIMLDLAGLVFRWRYFDHAAHLGGTLFGIFYAYYGQSLIWQKYRKVVMEKWHHLRG